MKRILLAAAAVLLAGPAFAQNVQFTIQIAPGVPANTATPAYSNFANSFIDSVQSTGTAIPPSTNADINSFQQTFTTGAAAINAANPSPNVQVPFTTGFTLKSPVFK